MVSWWCKLYEIPLNVDVGLPRQDHETLAEDGLNQISIHIPHLN